MKKIVATMMAMAIPMLSWGDTPYEELKEVLPYNNHGWYINGPALETIITQRNVKTVIELGSWLGKSTIHIASVLPQDGVVYAVDHWLGGNEHQPGADAYDQWSDFLPYLYEQFLSNVIHSGMQEIIVPVRKTTLLASEQFKQMGTLPDLVYIDASHDEDSVYKDLRAYFPLVKGHGIMCGDDWGWGNDLPVMKAVKRFAQENNLRIEVPNNWMWVLYEN